MARRPLPRRVWLGLRRCWRAISGWRIYLLALVIALPDILDGLSGLDLTPLLPDWLSPTMVALVLTALRLAARAYAASLSALLSRGPR